MFTKKMMNNMKNRNLIHNETPNAESLELYVTMDAFSEEIYASLPEFKTRVMNLIARGANPRTKLDDGSKATLLNILLMTNQDNVNANEINQLLKKNPSLINVKDGHKRTLFQHLSEEGFHKKRCDLSTFIKSSLILVPHLQTYERRELLNDFIDSGYLSEEIEQATKQLLTLQPTLVSKGDKHGNKPLQHLIKSFVSLERYSADDLVDLEDWLELLIENNANTSNALSCALSTGTNNEEFLQKIHQTVASYAKPKVTTDYSLFSNQRSTTTEDIVDENKSKLTP